jgi:peptidoglycan hydrolase FlgJ
MSELAITPPVAGAALEQARRPDGARRADDPAKVRDAAQQFEALLLAQILRSAGAGSGLFGSGSGGEGDAVSELAVGQFALALARQGGLGMTDLIAQGLQPAGTPSSE